MEKAMNVNGREYQAVRLLGKGKGGYSWLVTDGMNEYVLKQIHHEPCEYYQFGDKLESEIRDHDRLLKIGIPMPELYDIDKNNERILKEYIDGPTVMELAAEGNIPDECFSRIRDMCEKLYAANTNIDYYPTNFILRDGQLIYIDYECNDYMQEWDFEHWGIRYWKPATEQEREAHS